MRVAWPAVLTAMALSLLVLYGNARHEVGVLKEKLRECRKVTPVFDEARIKMMFKDPEHTKVLADVACKGGAIESIWLRFPLLTPEFPSSETHVTIEGAPSISTGTITPRWETLKNAELCKDPANAKYCGGTGK